MHVNYLRKRCFSLWTSSAVKQFFFCSSGGIISEESVVASLVERDDTDILARIALKLDKRKTHNWKHLALQLNVPHRVLRNFGSHQQHNSSLMLLKYIPIFDPELTLDHLKRSLASIGRQDAVIILDKAGIPGIIPLHFPQFIKQSGYGDDQGFS